MKIIKTIAKRIENADIFDGIVNDHIEEGYVLERRYAITPHFAVGSTRQVNVFLIAEMSKDDDNN